MFKAFSACATSLQVPLGSKSHFGRLLSYLDLVDSL